MLFKLFPRKSGYFSRLDYFSNLNGDKDMEDKIYIYEDGIEYILTEGYPETYIFFNGEGYLVCKTNQNPRDN